MEPTVLKKFKKATHPNLFLAFVASLAIYSMFFPVVVLDFWTRIYQLTYFKIMRIPKIKRSDYIVYDRWDLAKLNSWQKINCYYCSYVNGTTAWIKAVANQTEAFSCAIKHNTKKLGQEYQKEFHKYNEYKE